MTTAPTSETQPDTTGFTYVYVIIIRCQTVCVLEVLKTQKKITTTNKQTTTNGQHQKKHIHANQTVHGRTVPWTYTNVLPSFE